MEKHVSKQITREEARYLFIKHVIDMADYWENEERRPTSKEKLEGFAFSMLSFLDGSAAAMPGYYLIPSCHESDKPFAIDEGFDYYAQPTSEEKETLEKLDIGGSLHDQFHRIVDGTTKRPEGLKTFGDHLAECARAKGFI